MNTTVRIPKGIPFDAFKQVRLTRRMLDMDGYPIKADTHVYWFDKPVVELVGLSEPSAHIIEEPLAMAYINGYPLKGCINVVDRSTSVLVLEATEYVDNEKVRAAV